MTLYKQLFCFLMLCVLISTAAADPTRSQDTQAQYDPSKTIPFIGYNQPCAQWGASREPRGRIIGGVWGVPIAASENAIATFRVISGGREFGFFDVVRLYAKRHDHQFYWSPRDMTLLFFSDDLERTYVAGFYAVGTKHTDAHKFVIEEIDIDLGAEVVNEMNGFVSEVVIMDHLRTKVDGFSLFAQGDLVDGSYCHKFVSPRFIEKVMRALTSDDKAFLNEQFRFTGPIQYVVPLSEMDSVLDRFWKQVRTGLDMRFASDRRANDTIPTTGNEWMIK